MKIAKKPHRSLWLELFKVFLFICIAWIHYGDSKPDIYILARVALIMFFVISGCYCFSPRKENESDEDYYARKLSAAKKKIKSTLLYIAYGFAFFAIYDIIYGYLHGKLIMDIFKSFYYDNPFQQIFIYNHAVTSGGHMWYLLALLTISIIHYLCVRFKQEKLYAFFPLLVLVFLFFGVYLQLVEGHVVWGEKTRNALFLGLPCFAIGYDMHYLYSKFATSEKRRYLICTVAFCLAITFFFLQLVESKYILKFKAEGYVSGVLAAASFMVFFLAMPSPDPKWYNFALGKEMTFFAYLYHCCVGPFIKAEYGWTSGDKLMWTTIGVSIAMAILTHWIIFGIKQAYLAIKKPIKA